MSKRKRKRRDKVLEQVKKERAARRSIEIENGIKKQASGFHTSKKDKKESKKVDWDE